MFCAESIISIFPKRQFTKFSWSWVIFICTSPPKWICYHLLGIVVFLAAVQNMCASKMIGGTTVLQYRSDKAGSFYCVCVILSNINLAWIWAWVCTGHPFAWVKVHDCWTCCTTISDYYRGGTHADESKGSISCVNDVNIGFCYRVLKTDCKVCH